MGAGVLAFGYYWQLLHRGRDDGGGEGMADNLYTAYVVIDAFCFVYALTALVRMSDSLGSEHEMLQLRNMIYAYLVMILADIPTALAEGGFVTLDTSGFAMACAIDLIAVALGCYYWFQYVLDRLGSKLPDTRRFRVLATLPVVIVCVLDVLSVFTGWVFDIGPDYAFADGPLYLPHAIVDYTYLLVPAVMAVVRMMGEHSRQRRREYLLYTAYMVVPLLSGLFEDSLPTVPIVSMSTFMVINLFLLSVQDQQIFSDALTGLNNRRRLNRYLEERLQAASPEHPVAVFMMDVNDFKAINDGYGHVAGDNALREFAFALQSISGAYDAFIARYGGDEFCLVADVSEHAPEKIVAGITRSVEEAHSRKSPDASPCPISASIGYATCSEPTTNPEDVLRQADAMLYAEKRGWYRMRGMGPR